MLHEEGRDLGLRARHPQRQHRLLVQHAADSVARKTMTRQREDLRVRRELGGPRPGLGQDHDLVHLRPVTQSGQQSPEVHDHAAARDAETFAGRDRVDCDSHQAAPSRAKRPDVRRIIEPRYRRQIPPRDPRAPRLVERATERQTPHSWLRLEDGVPRVVRVKSLLLRAAWMRTGAICAAVAAILAFALALADDARAAPPSLATAVHLFDAEMTPEGAPVAFRRVSGAGATFVRLILRWPSVAPAGSVKPPGFSAAEPTDEAYRWNDFDRQIRLAPPTG